MLVIGTALLASPKSNKDAAMNHDNRGRLVIDTNGNWRLYTNSVPGGCTVLGTVSSGGETGALVVTEAGIYSMLNARVYRRLDQSKVKAALGVTKDPGRPSELGPTAKRRSIWLSDDDWELAKQIASTQGLKDASQGVRIALRAASVSE